MFIDLHNHSLYSYDSNRNMEDIVLEAIEKRVDILGFSDHLDFNEGDPGNEYYNGCHQLKEFDSLKNKYSSKITLHLGIEASLEKSYEEKILNVFDKFPFSYKIMSAHFVKGTVISDWIKEIEKDADNIDDADYSPYFASLKSISQFKAFDILGHIDYYKKYSKFLRHDIIFEKHKKDYTEILKRIIGEGKTIEINSSGLRHKCREQFPSDSILALYKELGGRTVSTGSDSHSRGDVAFHFNEVYNIIEKFDFKVYKPNKEKKCFP